MSRPEHTSAPQLFYDKNEASKYAGSTRMLAVQREITLRAVELLNLPNNKPSLLLDVGCGSGLSGRVLSEAGHAWIGTDISEAMLDIARENIIPRINEDEEEEEDDMEEEEDGIEDEEDDIEDEEDEEEDHMEEEEDEQQKRRTNKRIKGPGDVNLSDMGQGLPFRPNSFDGCVSISAVQWLAYSHDKNEIPQKRLRLFFSSLYACLKRGARAAIQLYPETPEQMEMITNAAMASGFTGGVVVDYPNSAKAKKFYLVLFAGHVSSRSNKPEEEDLPRGKGGDNAMVKHESSRLRHGGRIRKRDRRNAPATKSRDWILQKKERQRKQGKDVRQDSKFTGRRRRNRF